MGRINSGILGGVSGRVGGVSGSSWKGINYLKTRPQSVAVSQSAGSIIARGKWPVLTRIGSDILSPIIKPLWDRFAQKESGYNAWIRSNYDMINSSYAVVPASGVMSKGTLDGVAGVVIVADKSDERFAITWTNNGGTGNALDGDMAYITVYNVTQNLWFGFAAQEARSNEEVEILNGVTMATGNTLAVYLSFRRADGSLVSNSQYYSANVVA